MKIFGVLMAGGVGTRFWPRSRSRKPKQVLNIFGEETMIQATFARLQGLVDAENLLVVTNEGQKSLIREQIPAVGEQNLIIEPEGRNTAACIGLAAAHILTREPDAVMLVLPADHLISQVNTFQEVFRVAADFAAENDGLITLGIKPNGPATGYGYIQQGEVVAEKNGHSVCRVKTFAEKPNYETALRFLKSGDFYWNSGMFIWKASTILAEIREKLPEIHHGLIKIRDSIGGADYESVLGEAYHGMRSISIDFGVMQAADDVYVIPADLGWNDVGSWETVYEISKKNHNQNSGEFRDIIEIDAQKSYIYSPQKLVALVGVNDLIIVDTGDALLICKKSSAQQVKEVVEKLKKSGKDQYL